MHNYPFEKLEVWKGSIALAEEIYRITRSFPVEEKYGIISQLRRASTSISANISEGSSRFSKKEKIRFYEMAYGSAIECLNFMIISDRLNYLKPDQLLLTRSKIEIVTGKLGALVRSMRTLNSKP